MCAAVEAPLIRQNDTFHGSISFWCVYSDLIKQNDVFGV